MPQALFPTEPSYQSTNGNLESVVTLNRTDSEAVSPGQQLNLRPRLTSKLQLKTNHCLSHVSSHTLQVLSGDSINPQTNGQIYFILLQFLEYDMADELSNFLASQDLSFLRFYGTELSTKGCSVVFFLLWLLSTKIVAGWSEDMLSRFNSAVT